MQKFKKTYDAALDQARAKRAPSAIKLLGQAKSLEAKIARGRSPFAAEIAKHLADMYYVQGMSHLFAGRLPDAYKSFRRALEEQPGHPKSQRRLGDLEQKARKLFDEGEALRASNPEAARSRFKTVTQIVASGNPLYRRARQQLDALR